MKLAKQVKYDRKLERLIFESIDKEVYDFFFKDIEEIFNIPIYNELPQNNLKVVENLIKSGRIYYDKGYLKISGDFIGIGLSSKIKNALGVKYSKFKKGYKVDYNSLPYSLRLAIQDAQRSSLERSLLIQSKILKQYQQIDNFNYYDNTEAIKKFSESVNKKVVSALGLATQLGIDSLAMLQMIDMVTDRVTFNIRFHSKYRYENLMKKIINASNKQNLSEQELISLVKREVEIAKRHNAIIARNEANIIRGQVTKIQAQASGHDKYVWQTMEDNDVRPYHARLNGSIQSFSNPPIVDENNRTANPSEDYNCRCVARVILEE